MLGQASRASLSGRGLGELVHRHLGFTVVLLVGVQHHRGAVDGHQHEGGHDIELSEWAAGAGDRARVDEKLARDLRDAVPVRVPRHEDVHAEAAGRLRQRGRVAPGDDLVPVNRSDLEVTYIHGHGLGEVEAIVGVAAHYLAILPGYALQHVHDGLGSDVACADHHADLVRVQELLEAGRDVALALGHMEVADQQHKAPKLEVAAHRAE
mmetsp:Transcript_72854/g.187873  ORF Transcript_72854/g.187873 Transcript_72854/m.187873 type:complete len:209 (+) Transcript_72854:41-667(+)